MKKPFLLRLLDEVKEEENEYRQCGYNSAIEDMMNYLKSLRYLNDIS